MGDASGGGLSVRFRQALPIPLDAAIECGPGEMLALVGPSGSGKSTILRMIAGLNVPSQGRAACNGDLWLDTAAGVCLPPQARSAGLVFQHYALFPHLSARGNVEAALGHLPKADRGRRARELVKNEAPSITSIRLQECEICGDALPEREGRFCVTCQRRGRVESHVPGAPAVF